MKSIRRAVALVAGTALAFSGLTALNPAAEAAVDPGTPVGQAATWLVAQAKDGLLQGAYYDTSGGPVNQPWVTGDDQGLTIDAIESLVAVGADSQVTAPLVDAVEDQADTYAAFGNGAIAKLVVLSKVAGRDPDSFGGLNPGLSTQLEDAISTETGTEGMLTDAYDVMDSQILATRALYWAGPLDLASDATDFLLANQCTSGYFPTSFTDGCADGTTAPSVDATAYFVTQLAGIADTEIQAAVTKARTWLSDHQQADGSWIDGALGKSTNSIGLAVRALGAGSAATKGALWLRALQARTAGTCTDKLTGVAGALAPGASAWTDGLADGVTPTTTAGSSRPGWVRATAQALPALAFLPAATTTTMHASAPQGFVRAQTAQSVSVTGATPFGAVCISGGAARVLRYVGATGAVTASVLAPAGTATRTLALVDSAGHPASTSLKVLAAKKLSVAAPAKVKRGKKVTVRISGLQPTEQVQVVYKGTRIRAGHTNARGVFVAKFPVGRQLGKKVVRVYGQFTALRRGTDTVKVVR
jgi:hypothetical protein